MNNKIGVFNEDFEKHERLRYFDGGVVRRSILLISQNTIRENY